MNNRKTLTKFARFEVFMAVLVKVRMFGMRRYVAGCVVWYREAFLKLWSADHKCSSGSALVVLLDWTLVKNKINVNCVSHAVVEILKQFAFKGDKGRVVRRTFWLIKVVHTWKKFEKRWYRVWSAATDILEYPALSSSGMSTALILSFRRYQTPLPWYGITSHKTLFQCWGHEWVELYLYSPSGPSGPVIGQTVPFYLQCTEIKS
jgi:hypothetical protein